MELNRLTLTGTSVTVVSILTTPISKNKREPELGSLFVLK